MASRRQRILSNIKARLEGITTTDGYETNIGARVLLWELPRFGPSDSGAAVVIQPGEDQPAEGLTKLPIVLPVDIAVVLQGEQGDSGALVEAALRDVKVAIEAEPRDYGGLLRAGRNNPGGPMRGTTESYGRQAGNDQYGFVISYGFPYDEAFGDPDA